MYLISYRCLASKRLKKTNIYEESQPLQKRNQFMEALTDQLNGH